jgi:hypothetical protein
MGQTRRRAVCGMLTGAGLNRVWHHSRAHRLFSNARWSGDALGLALANLIVTPRVSQFLALSLVRGTGDTPVTSGSGSWG